MLKQIFDVILVLLAILLTYISSYFTAYFVQDGTWETFCFFLFYMGGVYAIKRMGRYYFVDN